MRPRSKNYFDVLTQDCRTGVLDNYSRGRIRTNIYSDLREFRTFHSSCHAVQVNGVREMSVLRDVQDKDVLYLGVNSCDNHIIRFRNWRNEITRMPAACALRERSVIGMPGTQ